jgi:hypothetical protein
MPLNNIYYHLFIKRLDIVKHKNVINFDSIILSLSVVENLVAALGSDQFAPLHYICLVTSY